MCGILAAINSSRNKKIFLDAQNSMIHRGPDFQNNIHNRDKYFLGHNRLSIIDLNPRSNQPFTKNELTIIFNGEIYNYKELINEHNLIVETTSDTEVILLMYQKYGKGCLKYFNGMFAIIIYNTNNNDFFVARDRLGIKPLYIYNKGNEWILSSEIGPLQKIVESDYDDFGLRQYRKLRMTLKGYTIYKDIKMFLPGYYLFNGQFSQYWELDNNHKEPPTDDYLRWMIEDAVKISLGIILVIIGLIGGLIPIFQGWMLGIPGLIILANYFPPIKRLLIWAKGKAGFHLKEDK